MYYVERSTNAPNSTFIWTIEGGNFESFSADGDTILVDWGETSGDYRLQVTEISDANCEGPTQNADVLVFESPVVDLGTSEEICQGDEFVFNLGSGFSSYLWHDGSTQQRYFADSSGLVWAQVVNEYGCSNSDSVDVIVHDLPEVQITYLSEDYTYVPVTEPFNICGDSTVLLNAGDYIFYQWSTGDITREIEIGEGARSITVDVEDMNGCISRDTVFVSRCNYKDFLGDITNVFTPNGDGDNDVWKIRNIEYFPEAEVVIYDRWGRLVRRYEGGYNNGDVAWDGTDRRGKTMPMDSYQYIIYLNVEDTEPIPGVVTIVR